MNLIHTFVVYVADHPGVLTRVASLFRRRGYNIESLVVGRTQFADVSRMTVVVDIDDRGAPLVQANLYKLREVLYVHDITSVPSVYTELALVKVQVSRGDQPGLICALEPFGCRVLEVGTESVVIELTGSEEIIDKLIETVKPYRILETTRTGGIAMTRGIFPELHSLPAPEQRPERTLS